MLLLNYMYELKYRAMHFDIIKMRKNIFSMEIWVTIVLTISNVLLTLTNIHVYQLRSFHTMELTKQSYDLYSSLETLKYIVFIKFNSVISKIEGEQITLKSSRNTLLQ